MQIIPHKKIFLSIAGVLVAASIVAIAVWGLPLGIDFTGGSLLEVEFVKSRPDNELLRAALSPIVGEIVIQPTGETGVILRFKEVTERAHQTMLVILRGFGELEERRFESIGPLVGRELQRKALAALTVVLGLIILYITWAFRKVSSSGVGRQLVSSWKYGLAAIVALIHDVTIPTGIVAVLGRWAHFQMDAFFITGLLTVIGFSVHDTIVVFDRIRENLQRGGSESFSEVANRSVNEVMARSINTSLAIILVLAAIIIFGGETTRGLAFVLALGVIFGTYSSIFVASPLLTLRRAQRQP